MVDIPVHPFTVQVPQAVLDDLKERLARARWPDEPPLVPWSTGTSVEYLQTLVEHWRERFDWRAQEAHLNTFCHFKVPLEGIELHFIHERGRGPAPLPLLLSHGWPGSVFEFHKLIPMLTDPARFGADPADAFTVVAPSLPGYVFSFRPGQERFGIERIADTFARLMSEVLGYPRFGAQGGDWGAFITTRLALSYPDRVRGIHLNMLAVRRDPAMFSSATAEERAFLEQLRHWNAEETGYGVIQGTKPQTLSFALSDSPVGLAAWLIEKYRSWSDCGGDLESVFTRDELLTCIMLYWVTGAIGSSFWPYYQRLHFPWPIPEGARIEVPTGYVQFPREMLHPPRSIAERTYSSIQRWSVAEKGGHFAALEQPQRLAEEIRAFFRPLRGSASAAA